MDLLNNWLVLALAAGLFSVVFNYGCRYILKTNGDSSVFSWWFELFRVIIFLFILPFDFWINPSFNCFFLLTLIGLIEFVSIYFYSKMHRESELSVSTIILRLRIVWIPIVAFLIAGEKLSITNYLGVLLVFLGLSFISTPKKIFYDNGMWLAFVSSFITAAISILIKLVSENASASVISLAMSIPSIFLFPLFISSWRKRSKLFYKTSLYGLIATSIASVLALYLQIMALKSGTVSQVMGIYQATSFVAVLAGIFILGEKDAVWEKVIGSVVVIFGAWLLI